MQALPEVAMLPLVCSVATLTGFKCECRATDAAPELFSTSQKTYSMFIMARHFTGRHPKSFGAVLVDRVPEGVSLAAVRKEA